MSPKTLCNGKPYRPIWYGWCWIQHRWHLVTQGADFYEVKQKLRSIAGRMHVPARHQLLTGSEIEPSWSPDGRWLSV
jgi:hypothetical protein